MQATKTWTTVVINGMFFLLFTYVVLGLNFVLAQNETAGTESSNNVITLPGIGESQSNQTRYNFAAADFFYPIKPGVDRTHWPERLTFEVNRDINVEDVKSLLSTQKWKTVYHCNGQALTVNDFKKTELLDGVVNPSAISEFYFDGNKGLLNITRYAAEINIRNNLEPQTSSLDITNIENLDDGEFKFSQGDPFSIYKILKVRETGEIVIQPKGLIGTGVCPDGASPKLLLVPYPNLMS